MTLLPEKAAELAKSPMSHKWKMIKAKVREVRVNASNLIFYLTNVLQDRQYNI